MPYGGNDYYSWNIIKNILYPSTNVYDLIVHVKLPIFRLLKYISIPASVGIAMAILLKKISEKRKNNKHEKRIVIRL